MKRAGNRPFKFNYERKPSYRVNGFLTRYDLTRKKTCDFSVSMVILTGKRRICLRVFLPPKISADKFYIL